MFITDDKFKKIADFVDELVSDKEEDTENETVSETEPTDDAVEEEASKAEDIPSDEEAIANENKNTSSTPSGGNTSHSEETDANDVVSTGIKFLTGLASALKTEEGKSQLINRLVKTDEKTGETSINIKVPDKNVVKQLLDVVGKLLG